MKWAIIKERVNAGISAARNRGVRLGRPSTLNKRRDEVMELFELADANRFAVEPQDLEEIAAKVAALVESISGEDWMKFFKDEDLW